jgi:hypothetical protein
MTRSPNAVRLRADYSARPARTGSKRDKLEAEQLRLSQAWCKHLSALANWRGHFQRLQDAPPSDWRSNECADALVMMRHHETTASAFSTLLESIERELKTFEKHEESSATARRNLAGYRRRR